MMRFIVLVFILVTVLVFAYQWILSSRDKRNLRKWTWRAVLSGIVAAALLAAATLLNNVSGI